jgi:CubicO group peptidase (beta-lactamase class C family)
VADALTMRLGLQWNEDLPYSDPRNSEIAMELADDRYRYVLSRPIVADPGTQWRYSGGATALLAGLIARGSGGSLMDYARAKLLAPLGIDDAEWVMGVNGREEAAASGLRLSPRDLAKIGQLVLNGGRWGERQVVPADWLTQSFTTHAPFDDEIVVGYGYHWWLGRHVVSGKPWYGAFGNGGQRLFIAPSLNIVIAVTAGNYNQAAAWKTPVAVQIEVLSALNRQ